MAAQFSLLGIRVGVKTLVVQAQVDDDEHIPQEATVLLSTSGLASINALLSFEDESHPFLDVVTSSQHCLNESIPTCKRRGGEKL